VNKVILVVLMMAGTYIPRLIPFLLPRRTPEDPSGTGGYGVRLLKKILASVPYAALGALILPGAVDAVPGEPLISVVGVMVAGFIAFFLGNPGLAAARAAGPVFVGLSLF
jgi:branched-subunit amino acid transport protein